MENRQDENHRIKFWTVVWLLTGLPFLLYVYFSPRPQCLKSELKTEIETYYDFSESGVGVFQAPVTKTICTEWDQSSK